MSDKEYDVLSPIKHDGDLYRPGETIVGDADELSPLMRTNPPVLGLLGQYKNSVGAQPQNDDQSLILEAVRKLHIEGDESKVGRDGVPNVKAVSEMVGFTVSAKMRDEAMQQLGLS